jgi:hypothetical protein
MAGKPVRFHPAAGQEYSSGFTLEKNTPEVPMDAHERLLETWSHEKHQQGRCFIKDGVIDKKRWRSVHHKVLFLLKEARHEGKGYWDLRKYLREDDLALMSPTWRNAAYWCYAIHHIKHGSLPGLPDPNRPINGRQNEEAVELLRSSAVVNIKKSDGRSSSRHEEIQSCAQRDKDHIKKQTALVNPDVVICGNTWGFIREWWPEERLYDGVYRVGQGVFVDFWHPSYHISNELKYYALAGQLHFSNALINRAVVATA